MMSVTWTCSPPSCSAMLPQKLSAATTWIRPFDPVDLGAEALQLNAARQITATTPGNAIRLNTPRRLFESDSRYNFFGTGSHSFSERANLLLVENDLHEVAANRLRLLDQRYTSNRRAIVDVLVSADRP